MNDDATLRVRGNSVARALIGASVVAVFTLWLAFQLGIFGLFLGVALMLTAATAMSSLTPYYCGRCKTQVASDAPTCRACGSRLTDSPQPQRREVRPFGDDGGNGPDIPGM